MRHVSAPVRVRSWFEAASWTSTKTATVEIWRFAQGGRGMKRIGRTSYPINSFFGGSCVPRVTGAHLTHTPHATFILHGCFAGDGAVNAASVAYGPDGWGDLRSIDTDHLASTGATGPHPGSIVRWDIEFDHGKLVTIDGSNGYLSNAGANLFPRVRLWSWRHGGFSVIADSGFTAQPAAAPSRTAPVLPGDGCPSDGTYRASFGVSYGEADTRVANTPLRLLTFPPSNRYPSHPSCTQKIPAGLPLTVLAAHTEASLVGSRYRPITNRRWITAPAWFLISGNQGFGTPTPLFNIGNDSPYRVPRSLGVNLILTRFRSSNVTGFGGYTNRHGVPPTGTVTFANGRITRLSIAIN